MRSKIVPYANKVVEMAKLAAKCLAEQPKQFIAMTANVFREDVENCLAAGMNGHVGKPLDFDKVLMRLRRCLLNQRQWGYKDMI